MAILLAALAVLLSPLAGASGSPVIPSPPATEWTMPEAAAEYDSLLDPFLKSMLAVFDATTTKSNARSYCTRLVRLHDTLNLGLRRGLWPRPIRTDVKRLLRASVRLRSKYRQCQRSRTGAGALSWIERNTRSTQRLRDSLVAEIAGLSRALNPE